MTKMRLRFAPSPTGALHIGGVRTAMYNYLLAKKMGGTFILRIEDTDQTRFVPGAESYIEESLEWLGITPDEGPTQGGDFGPYKQSERKHLYKDFAYQLIESGHAYFAFDTPKELTQIREEHEAKGETFTYNSSSRMSMSNSLALPKEKMNLFLKENHPFVIRFKMPKDENLSFNDIVRGEMNIETALLDDKVLYKSDGMPTYHLANIVDDHLMKITHVIRGEEWLPSLPLHVLLYRAFGWEAPQFAHLPLILKPNPASYITKKTRQEFANQFVSGFIEATPDYQNQESKVANYVMQLLQDIKGIQEKLKVRDKDSNLQKEVKLYLKDVLFGKLSKRDGDRLGIPVFPLDWNSITKDEHFKGFRSFGFLPEASLNFLAFLGWNPGTEQELFNIEELSEAFSLKNINKSGARFDFNKAKWYNKQYITAASNKKLVNLLKNDFDKINNTISLDYLEGLVDLLKERVQFLPDFISQGTPYIVDEYKYDTNALEKKWSDDLYPKFEILQQSINNLNTFSITNIESMIESFMAKNNIQMGQLFPLLRIALIGTMHGPGVYEMINLLGKDKTLSRIKNLLTFLNSK